MAIKLVILFLSSFLFANYLIKKLPKINLVDYPQREPHKLHDRIIPYAGGLLLIVGLFVSKWLFIEELNFLNIYFIGSATILFALGLWDDIKNLRVRYKFLGQLLAAIILYMGGFRVEIFNVQIIDAFFTIFWFVGICNAFNFVDGGDGSATGISIIVTNTLFISSLFISNQPELAIFCAVLLILLSVIYLKNKKPAKLFLGDSGSQVIGLCLAAAALYFVPTGYYKLTSWITPILIFIFLIFDVTLVTISRLKRGVSVFEAGLDHTYHRLMRKTKNHGKSNNYMFLIVLISNIFAIVTLIVPPFYGLIFGVIVLVFFGYSINNFESFQHDDKK